MFKYRSLQITLLILFCSALAGQVNRPASAGIPTDVPVANYGGPIVGMLNQAYRQLRGGQTEDALMTYNAILGQRPNWLPALVGKAEMLRRIGRQVEANRVQQQAARIDPLATGFLLARGRNALLRYLALYPESALPPLDMDDAAANAFSEGDYFGQQLRTIMQLDDSISLSEVLQAKVTGNRIKSIQILHNLMEDRIIEADLGFMLEGNLDMLNHDYLGAVAAYNQAIDFHLAPWPEITYNRGLAFILLDNYTNGCAELQSSAQEGFMPARKMLSSLCSF